MVLLQVLFLLELLYYYKKNNLLIFHYILQINLKILQKNLKIN